MPEVEAHRRLVKSPPELWAELSDPETLARHLGEFGEIRVTRTDPESTVAWEGEHVRGTVWIEPSGWGTRVSLSARGTAPEPEPPPPVEPPKHIRYAVRVVGEEVVRIVPPPPPEPEPEPPAPPPGFFARLFGRAPEPPPEPEPPPPPPEPYELRVVHA